MSSDFTRSIVQAKPAFDFVAAHFQCEQNRYTPENPSGFVNLGSAQNGLHREAIGDRLATIQRDMDDAHYQPFSGTQDCRNAISNYLQNQSGVPVSSDSIVIGNGVISVLEALTVALLNEGDSVLIPTPVFPGLIAAMSVRVRSKVELMHTRAEEGFQLTAAAVESQLHQLRYEGKRVRAIVLCSPGNPVGQVFTQSELQEFVEVAQLFDCSLIVDEIYAGSIFEGTEFTSAISLCSDNVFVLGGLSKDFGLAGYATGWLQSTNQNVIAAVAKQAHFFRLPAPILRVITHILNPSWSSEYLAVHQHNLTDTEAFARYELSTAGIRAARSDAGLCLWLDLREYISEQSVDGELELYQYLLNQHRVHISPGSGFKSAALGFFRVCFSQPETTLREGLTRLLTGLAGDQRSGPENLHSGKASFQNCA